MGPIDDVVAARDRLESLSAAFSCLTLEKWGQLNNN